MKVDQILMIAYYYPPIKSIGVIRNFHLSNEFVKEGFNVDVITTSNANILPPEHLDIHPEINVEQVYTFDYRNLMARGNESESPHLSVAQKENWFGRFSVKILRGFPFNLLIGEGGFFYIYNAYRKGAEKLKKQKGTTLIYSSFPAYSDHFVAKLLHKRFPKKTLWVADFRDLHTDPLYMLVYWEKFQHWMNRKVLSSATLVSTISNGLANQLKRYHDKVHVLMNGVVLEEPNKKAPYSKFTIAYTGSLFSDERDPSPLLKALSAFVKQEKIDIDKLQFCYAGKDGAQMEDYVKEHGMLGLFKNLGLISRKEALALQRNTHMNLLLTSSHVGMSGILTGKLFEYLAARNPILLLIKGQKDQEFESIFKKLNAGHIAYHGSATANLQEYIFNAYQEWESNGKLTHQINEAELQQEFSWKKSINDLLQRLEQEA